MKQTKPGYIVSESADFWLTGGISICVMSLVLLYRMFVGGSESELQVSSILGSAIVLQVLLNWPHFMGSYSILYSPKDNIRRYKAATIYVPLILGFIIFYALDFSTIGAWYHFTVNTKVAYSLWLVAAFYLAWHYTGQTWGMMAVFAQLSGLSFTPMERMVFRYCLRVLLVWHVVWGAQDLPPSWFGGVLSQNIDLALVIANVLGILSFLISFAVILLIKKRTGKYVDRRIFASWLSIYTWYLVLFFLPDAFMLVQASHALQYLAFPFRVELNRTEGYISKLKKKRSKNNVKVKTFSVMSWGFRYYSILVIAGLMFFYFPEFIFSVNSDGVGVAFMIASAINIHHFFVDSCIWHIRSKEVKGVLFKHLRSVA